MTFIEPHEFDRCLESALQAGDAHLSHALLYVKLRGLDRITDSRGQTASDALLLQCRYLLLPELGGSSFLTRLGSDRFALLLRDCSRGEALLEARLMRAALKNSLLHWQHENHALDVSIGLVFLSGRVTVADAMAAAEAACADAQRDDGDGIHLVHLMGRQTLPTFSPWRIRAVAPG